MKYIEHVMVFACTFLLAALSACAPAAGSAAPGAQPATGTALPPTSPPATPTPTPASYAWRGVALYLRPALPTTPPNANVYLLQAEQHATLEEARALAQRFGISGEAYQADGDLPGTTDTIITDGKQRLSVRSDQSFSYFADYTKIYMETQPVADSTEVRANIDRFLTSHGFDFAYAVNCPNMWGGYYVEPLTPDGLTLREEYFEPTGLLVPWMEPGR